jgi:hypothetical protein
VRFSRLSGAALTVAALVAAMVASAAYGITTAGIQGQMDFKSCISGTGADTCTPVGNALGQPTAMALSADESRLFVLSHGSNAVSTFVRDRGTGALKPMQANKFPCLTEAGGGDCFNGHGLVGPVDVAATGSLAFVVSDGSDSLVTVTKDNQSGAWKELDNDNGHSLFYCLASTTANGCQAANVPQTLVDPASVANAGSYVYVGGPGSIAVFRASSPKGSLRQLTTGLNNQDGCISDDGTGGDCATAPFGMPGTVVNMWISRDNKTLYAVTDADRLLVFNRGLSTGVLTQLQNLTVPNVTGLVSVAVDAASKATSVYVAGSNNAIGVFTRDKNTGQLSQPQLQTCVNETGSGGCTAAPALGEIGTLVGAVVYKTNRFAYAAGTDGLASFARNKSTLALTPLAAPAACTTETGNGGACLAGKGIGGLTDIQTTATKHEYVTGSTFNSVVALHLGG